MATAVTPANGIQQGNTNVSYAQYANLLVKKVEDNLEIEMSIASFFGSKGMIGDVDEYDTPPSTVVVRKTDLSRSKGDTMSLPILRDPSGITWKYGSETLIGNEGAQNLGYFNLKTNQYRCALAAPSTMAEQKLKWAMRAYMQPELSKANALKRDEMTWEAFCDGFSSNLTDVSAGTPEVAVDLHNYLYVSGAAADIPTSGAVNGRVVYSSDDNVYRGTINAVVDSTGAQAATMDWDLLDRIRAQAKVNEIVGAGVKNGVLDVAMSSSSIFSLQQSSSSKWRDTYSVASDKGMQSGDFKQGLVTLEYNKMRILEHLYVPVWSQAKTALAADTGTVSTNVITAAAHGLNTGDTVVFTTGTTGLALGTVYYAIKLTANTFSVADSGDLALEGTARVVTGTPAFTGSKGGFLYGKATQGAIAGDANFTAVLGLHSLGEASAQAAKFANESYDYDEINGVAIKAITGFGRIEYRKDESDAKADIIRSMGVFTNDILLGAF